MEEIQHQIQEDPSQKSQITSPSVAATGSKSLLPEKFCKLSPHHHSEYHYRITRLEWWRK